MRPRCRPTPVSLAREGSRWVGEGERGSHPLLGYRVSAWTWMQGWGLRLPGIQTLTQQRRGPAAAVPRVCRGVKAGPQSMVPSEIGAGKDFSGHRKIAPRCGPSCTARSRGWERRLATAAKWEQAAEWACEPPATFPLTGLRAPLHVAGDSSPRLAGRVECPLPHCFSFRSSQL